MTNMQTNKKNPTLQSILVGAKLLLICAVVAAVVAGVYHLTLSAYEENMEKTKNETIAHIFQGVEGLTSNKMNTVDGVELFRVYDGNGILIGYCAQSVSPGFGGDISLMIGYTLDRKIIGVRVLAMSETPGLGSKAGENDFLSGFNGKGEGLELNRDVDAITGATISSRAVLDGVNAATEALEKDIGKGVTMGGESQ